MDKCADCGEKSVWIFNDPGALPVAYCEHCLPLWLRPRAVNGTLKRVEQPEETDTERKPVTRATRKTKKTTDG